MLYASHKVPPLQAPADLNFEPDRIAGGDVPRHQMIQTQ